MTKLSHVGLKTQQRKERKVAVKKADERPPSSVRRRKSSLEVTNLSHDQLKYIESCPITLDDPLLVICWNEDVIGDLLQEIRDGVLVGLPPPPHYIDVESTG